MGTFAKIGYGLIGIILLAGFFMTGSCGLSDKDKEIYAQALELQGFADTLGFPEFRLPDYPVAVYTGDKEYVLQGESVTERRPALGVFAGTAYEVDGRYEVLIPAFRDMRNTAGAAGFAAGSRFAYTESDHTAAIWHEAFHAWQLTRYADSIMAVIGSDADFAEAESLEGEILKMDANDEYKRIFTEERRLLLDAVNAKDETEFAEILAEWQRLTESYGDIITDTEYAAAQWLELAEGTAYYVESLVYKHLEGIEAYKDRYLSDGGAYTGGRSKYYQTGMLKCLILDRLSPGWQGGFGFDTDLDAVIMEGRQI